MKKSLIFSLLLFVSLASLQGQYLEVGIMTGASNYSGELQTKTVEPSEIHPAFGLFARYNISRHFALRFQGMASKLSGSDSNARANNPLRMRNLSFESSILELALMAEVNLFGFDVRAQKGSSLFVFGGIGAVKFNPRAPVLGIMYDLQPLGTEGQNQEGNKYGLISATMPVGLGGRISISNRLNLSIEYGLRFTLTDYLDDVSGNYPDLDVMSGIDPVAASLSYRTPEVDPMADPNPFGEARGDASNMDKYMIGGITLSYNLANRQEMEYEEKYKW